MKRLVVDRTLLTRDPERPDGRPSYSYQRLIRYGLSLAQEERRRKTNRTLKLGGNPPPLLQVVPKEVKHAKTKWGEEA